LPRRESPRARRGVEGAIEGLSGAFVS
jgi:hypothetical protein